MPQSAPRLSLNVRLPLLIGGVLLVVIVIFGALSYRVASHAAYTAASERLASAANQLAAAISQQLAAAKLQLTATAESGPVQRFVNGDTTAAAAVLEELAPFGRDSTPGNSVEIRDAAGAVRLSVRPTTRTDIAAAALAPQPPDSAALSPIFSDGRLAYYEMSAPIKRKAGPPWYLIIRRVIDAGSGARAIAAMLGSDARIFVGNADGTMWADMSAPAESALIRDTIRNGTYRRAGALRLGAVASPANAPWLMGTEFSNDEVMSGSKPLMREMAGIAALVLLAGTLLGWVMSRQLTRPLVRLTNEAEQVARSSAETEPVGKAGDELARLSDAFGTMVDRVKDAQERLRLSEKQYRMLFDLNPSPMWVFDQKTLQFLAVNAAAVTKYGYSHEEFTRMTIRDIRPPQDLDALEQAVRTEFSARQDASNWRHITRDGTVFDVEIRGRPVTFLGADAELVLVTDVSERNRLESRLRQSQKMEAVGRLAGGIAHDFNNILSAVLGYSNLVLEDMSEDDPRRPDIEEVRDAGMRGAALTRQLLMFSRPQVAERQVLDINSVIAGVRKMLERIIGEDIVIETRLGPDLGRVRMDPGHLEQIVMNLAVNARDAMPNGGRLSIETSEVELDELHHRGNKLLPAGHYVMLAVSDVGIGIPKDQQARIFEPFYTTKPPGEGTGLGLSTVYGIVQQNGGSVLVYSEPGHGATFKVYLPRVEASVTTAEAIASAPPLGSARESILFVEDEPSLLKVGCQILARAGYTVIGMPGPHEAIAYANEHAGEIDLIATDMVMPGLSGREMVGRIRQKRPNARVLFMSGYTDDAIMQRGATEPGTAFLQKPFSGEGLARKVRAVLDGESHG
ncbi:MAG TPA: ATP-binding protein [Gemmatimonadales bacterium]|nr:ATP-binding protein [Gemmatimonadales bacterium]